MKTPRPTRTTSAWTAILLLSFFVLLLCGGCAKKAEDPVSPDGLSASVASCEGCHTDYQTLKKIASPDTAVAGGGCGGDAPHIEPYDRVYLGGEGYAEFAKSVHARFGCVSCHGGVDKTSDKQLAHSGDFVNHPSTKSATTCVPCHAAEHASFTGSLHQQGWGQKSMVSLRAGYNSFDQLPASVKSGYNVNCGKCHATCGDCHVLRPKAGGGGLYRGHKFMKTPNMTDNCVACHVSRGGHAYFGIGAGTVPDVHLTKLPNGGHCIGCHSDHELHGDGKLYNQRYQMELLPRCDMCHTNLAGSNQYHAVHLTTFNCQTCHSQDYNNCASCHIGGEGARVPSYLGFKIGMNPIPTTRPYKFATLRRSLMAPDSWKNYGIATLANFDVRPTYKYATPHNIIRWTTRTKVAAGKACYDNCHIIKEGTVFRNKGLYLWNSDLLSWEVNADKQIVVDGKLPRSWGIQ